MQTQEFWVPEFRLTSKRDQIWDNFGNIPVQKRLFLTIRMKERILEVMAGLEPLPALGNDGEKQNVHGVSLGAG